VPKSLEIDGNQDNLRITFTSLNVNFNSASNLHTKSNWFCRASHRH